VIDMALLSVIRRWHFREHLSIREICRRTGLSRNTIRKYLRAGGVEPKFKVPERPSKLDPFADRLAACVTFLREDREMIPTSSISMTEFTKIQTMGSTL
jgi:transcriptional regulator with XRE-family HTH domain